ncbi:hypothetical protein [Nonomuraea dietziae]|uniref:TetR/AcrR family transcriptional regulator n=1 Tax=Nonomuraea dietziae TaxID=65515 RepID=UPI0031D76B34
MRRVAQELGVEAMSLYHHVPNKDAILDGVVDAVFAAIELPSAECDDWARRDPRARLLRACGPVAAQLGARPHGLPSQPWACDATPPRRRSSASSGRRGSRCRWPRTLSRSSTATSAGSSSRRRTCR